MKFEHQHSILDKVNLFQQSIVKQRDHYDLNVFLTYLGLMKTKSAFSQTRFTRNQFDQEGSEINPKTASTKSKEHSLDFERRNERRFCMSTSSKSSQWNLRSYLFSDFFIKSIKMMKDLFLKIGMMHLFLINYRKKEFMNLN